jgi:hypothetical protein
MTPEEASTSACWSLLQLSPVDTPSFSMQWARVAR